MDLRREAEPPARPGDDDLPAGGAVLACAGSAAGELRATIEPAALGRIRPLDQRIYGDSLAVFQLSKTAVRAEYWCSR